MVSAVLAYPTRALQGTNWGSGPAMEESENDVGSLEQHFAVCGRALSCWEIASGRPFRKGSARKGCLDLRFASARCLEIVCGNIATPTSARIVERVTVGSTRACARFFYPLSSWSSWSLLTRLSVRGYLLMSIAPNNF
ncbi:hypothetical protein TNCV_4629741 [Trichonephila clavipes]|nr:hypothetical protein TNCV_4629741 [Trichonephila clavipes]